MKDYLDMLAEQIQADTAPAAPTEKNAIFDSAEAVSTDEASSYEVVDLRLRVAGAFQAWAEESADELDEDESLQDRLDAMFIGIVDEDKNGDIDEDESKLLDVVYNIAFEYLLGKGVSEADAQAMLGDADEEAAERVQEFLINVAPEGEEAEIEELNNFAFDKDSDDAAYDATYKKRVAFRNGKRVIIRKRVSGRVKLSAKQKMAVKKMLRKSHSSAARIRRMKTMKKRRAAGL